MDFEIQNSELKCKKTNKKWSLRSRLCCIKLLLFLSTLQISWVIEAVYFSIKPIRFLKTIKLYKLFDYEQDYFLAMGKVIASCLVIVLRLPSNQNRRQEVTARNRIWGKDAYTCHLTGRSELFSKMNEGTNSTVSWFLHLSWITGSL